MMAAFLYARRNGKNARCVCGHPHRLTPECPCGCTMFEADNGTCKSPTPTGDITSHDQTNYNGRYTGPYRP
jgi:hypothetical protein